MHRSAVSTTNRLPIAASMVLGRSAECFTFWLPTLPGYVFLQYTQRKGIV